MSHRAWIETPLRFSSIKPSGGIEVVTDAEGKPRRDWAERLIRCLKPDERWLEPDSLGEPGWITDAKADMSLLVTFDPVSVPSR